jgi:hypothetical protein
MDDRDEPKAYVPPAIVLLGSVHGLTQARGGKNHGASDGFLFHGHQVTNTSA